MSFPFLSLYRAYFKQQNNPTDADKIFLKKEKIFLSVFQLGIFEVYQYLYAFCEADEDFEDWIICLKGEHFYHQAIKTFTDWENGDLKYGKNNINTLTDTQHFFWETNGFLQIRQAVTADECDAVVKGVLDELSIDLTNPQSWYPQSEKLQGLMLQTYQGEAISLIRNSEFIKDIFSSLYKSNAIVPNCEKLSYNPPENEHFKFAGSPLHWDIDFTVGSRFHIQGLVYLNDVPEDRGPLKLIPGYHKNLDTFLAKGADPNNLINSLSLQNSEIKLAGKKGDLVVWLESLPHAATPNRSNLPRFVQYVSFTKLDALD